MLGLLWKKRVGSYRGLTMRCAPGTHEAAMGLLQEAGVKAGAVLDLASGSGALIARLKDHGFSQIAAVELDSKKFLLEGIVPLAIDLNTDFAKLLDRRFGLITAVEIIEHLNSPRHFLSQVRELLDEDGVLLLTTPNVAEWVGRIRFFITGTLRYFDDGQYAYNHHISPLPEAQMRHLLAEVGLDVVARKTAGGFFGPLKMACLLPLWLPIRLLGGPSTIGDVNLYLLRRAEPRSSSIGDWTPTG